ncbi:MAG: tetratricopeptide repeat protein [Nanoarchaeota archaeon]
MNNLKVTRNKILKNLKLGLAGLVLAGGIYSTDNLMNSSKNNQELLISNKKDYFVDSITSKLNKYPTTTHFIYEIQGNSEQNFSNVNKLDKIINNIKNKFSKKEQYSKDEVIEMLNAINKEIGDLEIDIKDGKIDCDDLSFIYLAVGEKLNLNLYGVYAPGHVFIRYDSDGKHDVLNSENPINNEDFNWETTNLREYYDKKYIEEEKISKESIENGIYMKNLTKLELLSLGYFNQGNNLFDKKEYNLAIESYDNALKLYPKNFSFIFNKNLVVFSRNLNSTKNKK